MKIENVNIFKETNQFEKGVLYITDEKITESETDGVTINGEGLYAIPGLIDLHFHGCMGYDVCDGTEEALEKIANYEVQQGITCMAPATMTLPVETLKDVLSTTADYVPKSSAEATYVGLNMEGPFISHAKKGAQNENYILPVDVEIVDQFVTASKGLAKFIAVAPEKSEDTYDFIEKVKGKINVTLGHTGANYEQASKAFAHGVNHVVHLYNAMPLCTHRAPGVIGALYDNDTATAELICDLVHVHPSTVRTTFKVLGSDRVILISDTMRATGLSDGEYTLGGLDVTVKGNQAVLTGSDTIAGSVTNLMDCLRIAILEMKIPMEDAIKAATINPAKKLGIAKKYGSLSVGKFADVVLLDRDLQVKYVLKHGKIVNGISPA
ncbi:MAG: N-acetylglucosamine-6-phosphate deacetylase [Bacillota bacterium]